MDAIRILTQQHIGWSDGALPSAGVAAGVMTVAAIEGLLRPTPRRWVR